MFHRAWYHLSTLKSKLIHDSKMGSTVEMAMRYFVPAYLQRSHHALWYPGFHCPACRTSLIATRFWVVMICPIIKCRTVLEFSLILFDLCLFITIFNFILNYVPSVTFWIFTYHKIWILLIIFCFIWNYCFIYFFNMFGSVLECCELTGVSLLWPWLIKWK